MNRILLFRILRHVTENVALLGSWTTTGVTEAVLGKNLLQLPTQRINKHTRIRLFSTAKETILIDLRKVASV